MKLNECKELKLAVKALGPLVDEVVFTGGSVLPLYFDEGLPLVARATKDADCVIECASQIAYMEDVSQRLRAQGLQEPLDEDAPPLCRWLWLDDDGTRVLLDVMPTEGNVLGFSNRWYPAGFKNAVPHDLGREIRIFSAPYFIATKIEAFGERGQKDFYSSHDLEDIINVFAGRTGVENEILGAMEDVREYIRLWAKELLSQPSPFELIEAHLDQESRRLELDEVAFERISRVQAMS